ncbi:MAG TPA: sigma-54 dependent transcriptional regulator [Candidatus Acidoferrales bacterium]|nr:sigma-54 dependent transcriptional regulator [Candidatus Acidoferrales bacterium]
MHRILIVDDDPLNLDLLSQELTDMGHKIETASGGTEALAKLGSFDPELILLDYQMPQMSGIEVLREIRKTSADLPVIMITAYGTIERAVETMKAGADEFITKPFDPDHLALVVNKALERVRLRSQVAVYSEEAEDRYHLIEGKSRIMAQTVDQAKKAARSNSTILLLGESGTGKELFARLIHQWSERRAGPFVAINCVGLSKDLLESELFGHEKGAFTGAHQLKRGKMEVANGGSVFLDEVGDVSAEFQTKLLRFLQEREFERVGGNQPIAINVRVVAATNRNLESAISSGAFREDLYHRLNVIAITLPPLRDRKEDIPPLANHFLHRFAREAKKNFTEMSEDIYEKLLAYPWPGNVRELANVIERAVVLGDGPKLTVHHMPARVLGVQPPAAAEAISYHDAINAYRREILVRSLAAAQGNRAAAAKALGLHRTHLMKLIKALKIN